MSRLRVGSLWLLCGVAASSCQQAPPPAEVAYLKVAAEPAQTTVYLNDRFIGSAHLLQKQPKVLPSGLKYLTFKAPGYFPHDLRITLPKGETTVTIKLRPIPP
ncbi:MAG: hypothetical protein RL701_3077 [Pseudomonadota bacterium]|jgi:hypothetical protein